MSQPAIHENRKLQNGLDKHESAIQKTGNVQMGCMQSKIILLQSSVIVQIDCRFAWLHDRVVICFAFCIVAMIEIFPCHNSQTKIEAQSVSKEQ